MNTHAKSITPLADKILIKSNHNLMLIRLKREIYDG